MNYELPNVPEDYVHRIGRTGRAGAEGCAISLVSPDERGLLRDIERVLKHPLKLEQAPEFVITQDAPVHQTAPSRDAPHPHRHTQRQHRTAGRPSSHRGNGQESRSSGNRHEQRRDHRSPASSPHSSGTRSFGPRRSAR